MINKFTHFLHCNNTSISAVKSNEAYKINFYEDSNAGMDFIILNVD